MNEVQQEFFRALCAPFDAKDLYSTSKGGRVLTYVKAPTLMNRLDDVCGPAGWDIEYRATERGFTAKLGILVPGAAEGTAVWHYKEDGGGFEGMTKKTGGDTVSDDDNDEKSGYTNAFRRACYAWGLARELWRCGIPEYLGREPVTPDVPPPAAGRAPAPAGRQGAPARAPARAPAPPSGGGNSGGYDNFAPPRVVRGMYPWTLNLEKHFGDGVKKLSNDIAKEFGYPFKSNEWDMEMVTSVAWAMIDDIRSPDSQFPYNGEFDHLEDPRGPEA